MFSLSNKPEKLDGQITIKIRSGTITELSEVGPPSTVVRDIVEHALNNWEAFQKLGA